MKILHILKKPIDDSTKKIIETQKAGNEVKIIEIYKGGIDYNKLVSDVFSYDRVFTW